MKNGDSQLILIFLIIKICFFLIIILIGYAFHSFQLSYTYVTFHLLSLLYSFLSCMHNLNLHVGLSSSIKPSKLHNPFLYCFLAGNVLMQINFSAL